MKTDTKLELLAKIEALITNLTQQMHAVSFSLVNGKVTVDFLCRGTDLAACHFYADCYCEFELHVPKHKEVQQRRCYLSDLFTYNYSLLQYEGEDFRARAYMDWVYAFPEHSRTGFIKTRVENGCVFWSWLELSDLELKQVSA